MIDSFPAYEPREQSNDTSNPRAPSAFLGQRAAVFGQDGSEPADVSVENTAGWLPGGSRLMESDGEPTSVSRYRSPCRLHS